MLPRCATMLERWPISTPAPGRPRERADALDEIAGMRVGRIPAGDLPARRVGPGAGGVAAGDRVDLGVDLIADAVDQEPPLRAVDRRAVGPILGPDRPRVAHPGRAAIRAVPVHVAGL